jgi:hypothetical protein
MSKRWLSLMIGVTSAAMFLLSARVLVTGSVTKRWRRSRLLQYCIPNPKWTECSDPRSAHTPSTDISRQQTFDTLTSHVVSDASSVIVKFYPKFTFRPKTEEEYGIVRKKKGTI